jgi:hypothetical protein
MNSVPYSATVSTKPDNLLRNRAIVFVIVCFLVTYGLYFIASMGNGNTLDNFLSLLFAFLAIAIVIPFAFLILSESAVFKCV